MLPDESKPFPAPAWAPVFDRYAANSAWWSDNIDRIAAVYGAGNIMSRGDNPATHHNNTPGLGGRFGSVIGSWASWFTGRGRGATASGSPTASAAETRLHIPAAGNIAAMSAAALMQSPPTVRATIDGKPAEGPLEDALAAMFATDEHRLEMYSAAEVTAGLGAVALTAHWDPTVSEAPWMQHTACDAAIPEFIGRRVSAVNLWTTYPILNDGGLVTDLWYHVERHQPGAIVHALYRGTTQNIGTRARFDADDMPDNLRGLIGTPGTVWDETERTLTFPTGIPDLTVSWWRNRQTKEFREHGQFALLGRADIEGAEQILDAIDRTWSSWMRDINVGRAQMIVPKAMTESLGEGLGSVYDATAEYITPLEFTTMNAGEGDRSILVNQFAIRHEAHAATHLGLLRELTIHAGWTVAGYGYGSSSGESGGSAVTAREVSASEGNSAATLDVKQLEFKAAMSRLAPAMVALNAAYYGGPKLGDARLAIEFEDTSDVDPLVQAQIMAAQRQAQAVSIETLVRGLHPDWEDRQVDAERDLIYLENGIGEEADPGAQYDANGVLIEPTDDEETDPEAEPTEEPAEDDDA